MPSNDDFLGFVANLRSSGCPEGTVEDIVRGDVERAFFAKRSELGIDGSEPGPWSARAQMQLVASLLGQRTVMEAEPIASASSILTSAAPPTVATFLQNVDLTTLGQNDEQKQEIANLRQNLLEQIGNVNPAPNSPANLASQAGETGTPSSQTKMDGTQSSQAGTDGTPSQWRPKASQSMLQAEEAESILGGLFGIGAAIQYDQYQAEQQAAQN